MSSKWREKGFFGTAKLLALKYEDLRPNVFNDLVSLKSIEQIDGQFMFGILVSNFLSGPLPNSFKSPSNPRNMDWNFRKDNARFNRIIIKK